MTQYIQSPHNGIRHYRYLDKSTIWNTRYKVLQWVIGYCYEGRSWYHMTLHWLGSIPGGRGGMADSSKGLPPSPQISSTGGWPNDCICKKHSSDNQPIDCTANFLVYSEASIIYYYFYFTNRPAQLCSGEIFCCIDGCKVIWDYLYSVLWDVSMFDQ